MAFRDDHDAALARAAALERELERSEADRERLRAEVERLEHAADAPATALVVAAPTQLTAAEIDELIVEVDRGLRASRASGRRQIVLACLLIAGGLATLLVSAEGGLLASLVGVLTLVAAAVGNGGDHTAILAAVRDAPERIRVLLDTGRGRLKISTGYHTAFCKTRTSSELLGKLSRHCPSARVERVERGPVIDDS